MTARPSHSTLILTVLAIVLVMMPILYVLSLGPAIWLVQRDYISNRAFEVTYHPLHAANDRLGTHEWLGWYLSFWQKVAPSENGTTQ